MNIDIKKVFKSFSLSVLTLLLSVTVLYGASTIGAAISTTSTLDVTGLSTLTGGYISQASSTVAGTLTVTGNATSSGYLTVGTAPTGANFGAGDFNVQDDVVIGGGSLTVTTTNSATSSVKVGCVQTTATSTNTYIKMQFISVPTSSLMLSTGVAPDGFVVWSYGTCN